MGEPYFQTKHKLKQRGIVAFSSNYALYGDMSERVMSVIDSLLPGVEVYSIDEALADIAGVPVDLEALGRRIRAQVYQSTGIPVGVGIASTKTLSKLAWSLLTISKTLLSWPTLLSTACMQVFSLVTFPKL